MAHRSEQRVTNERIDGSFVPRAITGLTPVVVDDELVLLDGWNLATRFNPTGALIWSSLDGETTLQDLAADLASASGLDQDLILADLVRFVSELAGRGLLEGVEATVDEPDIHVEVVTPHVLGDVVDDLELPDLDGKSRRLSDLTRSGTVMLVNWNPHCGYCARIAHDLADLQPYLHEVGCVLALLATGSVEANRAVAVAAGLDAPVLSLAPDHDPFRSAGTPSAYHLDPTGRIIAPPAYGADQVPALARAIARVHLPNTPPAPSEQVRYLLERDGLCAPTWRSEATPAWAGTRVYRLAGYHVGIRYDSPATAAHLDRLLLDRRVDDQRAGHSFSIALGLASRESGNRSERGLSFLVQAGQPTLRSRDPARVLQALLSRLSEGTTVFDPACGRFQVDAIAALHPGGAALLPWNLHGFAPRLQPLLAREGVALADLRHPEVDPVTAELVVPEPAIDHDPEVLAAVAVATASGAERPTVRPGRYPLTTWAVVHPSESATTPLSPAEAAAATLSTVLHTDDAPERVRQLAELFGRVDGVGIWYHSEPEFIAALVEALANDKP